MDEQQRSGTDRRRDQGFTLIELLVVVVIIGILVAIAIPLYLNYTQGGRNDSLQADVHHGVVAVQMCYSDLDQNLPAGSVTLTATGPLNSSCKNAPLVVSSGTAELVFTNTTKTGKPMSYTLEAFSSTGSGATTFTYDSTTGDITQGTS